MHVTQDTAPTAETVTVFASEETYQKIATLLNFLGDDEVTAESLRADIESVTGANHDDFKLAEQLSFNIENEMNAPPSHWVRLLGSTDTVHVPLGMKKLESYIAYLDIMLHNDEMNKPSVREKINITLDPHDINRLLASAEVDSLHNGFTAPKIWKCLQTLCALHFQKHGSLPNCTVDKISKVAYGDSTTNAEYAATTLRSFTHLHAAPFAKQTNELV